MRTVIILALLLGLSYLWFERAESISEKESLVSTLQATQANLSKELKTLTQQLNTLKAASQNKMSPLVQQTQKQLAELQNLYDLSQARLDALLMQSTQE